MDKIANQIKVLQLFGTVGGVSLSLRKNEVGIRWKDNVLIRGGLIPFVRYADDSMILFCCERP